MFEKLSLILSNICESSLCIFFQHTLTSMHPFLPLFGKCGLSLTTIAASVLSASCLCGSAPSASRARLTSSAGCRVGVFPSLWSGGWSPGSWCQDLVFFLLHPSSVIFLSPRLLSLFVLGPFLLVLPGCLHVSISGWCLSVSGCASVCFTTSLGGSSAWLSLCLFLSLSSLFPCLSLSSVFVTSSLHLSVSGWACLGALAISFQLFISVS